MPSFFGDIQNPITQVNPGASVYENASGGLPVFINNIVKVILVGGGLFAFFNLIFAGFTYITANGDQKKLEAAVSSINMSILGLTVMVAAGIITGIVSFILFGDPLAIMQPTILGPGNE